MSRRGKDPRGPAAAPPAAGRGGFSLVEVLMVLALFALLSTVMITGANTLFPGNENVDAEGAALTALQEARREAVTSGRTVILRLEEKKRQLVWAGGASEIWPETEKLRLVQAQREATVLIGGVLMEEPLAQVRFYSDGTCDPLRLQIVRGQQTRVVTVDPWTCAPLPEAKEGG